MNAIPKIAHRRFTRAQRMIIVYGILCMVLILVILQVWLLSAIMNAYLGGDNSVIWPAAMTSLVCLGINGGLLRYLYFLDKPAPND
jgi:hypothetical protein